MERALVAKVGTLVFAVVLGLPVTLSPASAQASVMVAGAAEDALAPFGAASVLVDLPELRLRRVAPGIALAATSTIEEVATPASTATSAPPPPPPVAVATAAPIPPPEPLILDGVVIASWYGPGFYGNRTACGLTYTPEIPGVAHLTLPCGTQIRITSRAGVTTVVPVIDRGPYVAGRTLDLSNATKLALGCSDLCTVRMAVLR